MKNIFYKEEKRNDNDICNFNYVRGVIYGDMHGSYRTYRSDYSNPDYLWFLQISKMDYSKEKVTSKKGLSDIYLASSVRAINIFLYRKYEGGQLYESNQKYFINNLGVRFNRDVVNNRMHCWISSDFLSNFCREVSKAGTFLFIFFFQNEIRGLNSSYYEKNI